jgi:hypothetical protein
MALNRTPDIAGMPATSVRMFTGVSLARSGTGRDCGGRWKLLEACHSAIDGLVGLEDLDKLCNSEQAFHLVRDARKP